MPISIRLRGMLKISIALYSSTVSRRDPMLNVNIFPFGTGSMIAWRGACVAYNGQWCLICSNTPTNSKET